MNSSTGAHALIIKVCAALLALSFLAFTSCEKKTGEAEPEEVTVAAAANLTDAFGEIARRFTAKTGVRVVNSFGATASLARQVDSGAPFDVFASADVSHLDELAGKGLLTDGTRAVYARGRLVLWLPSGKDATVNSVEDLAGDAVKKVAIAKPDIAPYGQAAVESLRALKVWEKVEPKVVYSENVAEAKQFAASGNADAAFIPRALLKEGEGRAVEVDESLHAPIDQAIAVVRASKKQAAARRFVEFVTGEEGQSVLKSFGYSSPAGK
ncbi:MAG TPA: molybdate ABC transporter substrate-binding protein [Pyrinomonadaceae bacterium]|nr:molybdate ABC transporter substrate-binding protein [Pyrinomonadaceae bacterium]